MKIDGYKKVTALPFWGMFHRAQKYCENVTIAREAL